MGDFGTGDRVRISENAFANSDDEGDIKARGQIATLGYVTDEDENDRLWEATLEDGTEIAPYESELLPLDD